MLELLRRIDPDVFAACLTVFGSLVVTCATISYNNKVKFFESYFLKKCEAYSQYLTHLTEFYLRNKPEVTYSQFLTSRYIAEMFCTDSAVGLVKELDKLFKQYKGCKKTGEAIPDELVNAINETITAFRKDVHQCRRFRF